MRSVTVEVPQRMQHLKLDKHGRPVPWFVAWIHGQPDHRVIRRNGVRDALRFGYCWVCGDIIKGPRAYTIGPMCLVNRISAEPPAHPECAEYSAQTCPFLTTPNMVRRERHMPANSGPPAGEMIRRNPGVAVVWPTTGWPLRLDLPGGSICKIGPLAGAVTWWCEGRPATHAEALTAFESGLPGLREAAELDAVAARDPRERNAIWAEFDTRVAAALPSLPAE